jgi:hypothetical protein
MNKKAAAIFTAMSGDPLAAFRCPYCLSNIWMRKDASGEAHCTQTACMFRRINDNLKKKKVVFDSDAREQTSIDNFSEDIVAKAEQIVAAGTAPKATIERLSALLGKPQATPSDFFAITKIVNRYGR